MRSRPTAATGRGNDVDPEAGLAAAGGMSAAVVRREEFDVLVKFPPGVEGVTVTLEPEEPPPGALIDAGPKKFRLSIKLLSTA